MSEYNLPSDQLIDRLLENLPKELERVLEKYSPNSFLGVPDYISFDEKARALLKPFLEYHDAKFHSGDFHNKKASRAMEIFSQKKYELSQILKKFNQESESDRFKLLKTRSSYKLLFHFIENAGSPSSSNMLKMHDLLYQAQLETDPQKCQSILDDASTILNGSSTGSLLLAEHTFQSGDLETARKFCEQAIERLPENTEAYELKARILQAEAKKELEKGLNMEPRDVSLQIAHKIADRLQSVRNLYAKGLLTQEEAIEHIEDGVPLIQKDNINLAAFKEIVDNYLHRPSLLDTTALNFLYTGEWLICLMPKDSDFAASAIEFCKAVEIELMKTIFEPFRVKCLSVISQDKDSIEESRVLRDFTYREGKLTLGGMAMVFQFLGSNKTLRKSIIINELRALINMFPQPKNLLGKGGLRSLLTAEAVQEYRNKAAHSELFSLEKAKMSGRWCYDIINKLTDSI